MHEDLLRHIWSRQLFDTERLVTTDGRAVRISSPGNLSRKSGPDFREARIGIGGVMFTGDVEFHRTAGDWLHHDHHNDPRYNSVILHVVLFGSPLQTHAHSGRIIPTVILEPFLRASVERISDQLAREEHASRRGEIPCASINDPVPPELLDETMKRMYRERLQEKIMLFHTRLSDIITAQKRSIREPHPPYPDLIDEIPLPDGTLDKDLFRQILPWEQLLFEQIMDALGYSNNREPMMRLAEIVSVPVIRDLTIALGSASEHTPLSPVHLEALLFKVSGLLPPLEEISDQDSKVYVHSLLAAWKELPRTLPFAPLAADVWNFSPTRPANFPTIRIAAAALFLFRIVSQSLFRSIITIIGGRFSSTASKTAQLTALFDAGEHPFWSYHYSFAEGVIQKHAVIGRPRTLDILVNTVVPFTSLYAKIFGNEELFDHCLNLAVDLPLLEENSVVKRMELQLLKQKITMSHAYQQQGLIQLHKRYCTSIRCAECAVGRDLALE